MIKGHAVLLIEISCGEWKNRQAEANALLAEKYRESCVRVVHLLCIRGSSLREGGFIPNLQVNHNVKLRHSYVSLLLFCAFLLLGRNHQEEKNISV